MSVISPHQEVEYESSKYLFARIKRRLKSYNSAGLIDENDFYDYVMDIFDKLGIGGLTEEDAILYIVNKKCKLPENFKQIYTIDKCKEQSTHPILRPQDGRVFYTDATYESKCKADCCGDKVTIRSYIEGIEDIRNYHIEHRIDIVPKTAHLRNHQVYFEDGYIHTQFDEGELYIKYYAYPMDEDGLPMIPKTESIQRLIEYYIVSQLFQDFYWNGDVPDGIAQKLQDARAQYQHAWQQASYESKLPQFATLIDAIRRKRRSLDVYKQTDFNGSYRRG